METIFLYSRKLISHRNGKNQPYNDIIKELAENPKKIFITFLTGKCISIIAIVLLIADLVFNPFMDIGPLIIVLVISFFFLCIFGELLPKIFIIKSIDKIEKTLIQLTVPMKVLQTVFSPINYLFILTMSPLLEKIAKYFINDTANITEEEILAVVDLGAKTGVLESDETELLRCALSFDETPVKDVMVPRVDMICSSSNSTIDETLNQMIAEGYSRLPVYEGSLDNIIGIVNLKDLIQAKQIASEGSSSVKTRLRKAFYLPESKPIDELLKEMQSKRLPMAIVIDEYGGTAGLVTMEDLLEEIVGEIRDEHDHDEPNTLIEQINENTIKVDAKVSVEDVNDSLQIALPEGHNIASLVFNSLGHVPQRGEILMIDNISIKVEEMEGIRVQKVIIQKL